MRKNILVFFALVFLIGFYHKKTFAQTFDAAKAYQDYQYSLDIYNQANTAFENAKNFYLTNKTLTLKEDTRKKLLVMLKDRDQLESVYLTALRMKMLETNSSISGNIEGEIAWYKDHINNYKDSDPAEDLFNKSSESESRYKTNTAPIVYESLFNISLGEEIGIRQDHEAIYSNLKSMITDPNPFNRWFTDIDLTINELKQNEDLSKTQIQKIYDQYSAGSSSYNSAIETLASSVKPLTQLNSFLTEVATSIKNQQ